jgi:kynurenine formamidase
MAALHEFMTALSSGAITVIDLTAPLSHETAILELPPEFGQTQRFELEEISRYDGRGPAWYWNNFHTGEHTGTHFDAPNHWVTGKDKDDIASVPVTRLIGPAAVLDFSAQVADNPDFLIEIDDVRAWETEHGPLPDGGWLLVAWPTADQWIFLHGSRAHAVANIEEQFPRADHLGPMLQLAGRWCCR